MKTQHVPRPRQRRNDVVLGSLLAFCFNASAYGTPTVGIAESASDHPIVASVITLFVMTTLLLGFLHECEIGGEVLILLVRMFKDRAHSLRNISKRLKAQFSTWDDPEDAPVQRTTTDYR